MMPLAVVVFVLLVAAGTAFPYIPGPASQAAQPAWIAEVYANRTALRASVNYTTDVYDNFLLWSPSLHIAAVPPVRPFPLRSDEGLV